MTDYYDYDPAVTLDRHLVLAGYITDVTRRVGYHLASVTGLPAADLDRKIEHRAGQSIWKLIWSEGEARYRELERDCLEAALRDRPFGVVSVGDGALIDDDSRRRIAEEARLVVLDLDLPNCYWRLKSGPDGDRDAWHPLYPFPLDRFEVLRPFHELRQPGFADADHHIELRGKSRSDVVDELMKLMPAAAA